MNNRFLGFSMILALTVSASLQSTARSAVSAAPAAVPTATVVAKAPPATAPAVGIQTKTIVPAPAVAKPEAAKPGTTAPAKPDVAKPVAATVAQQPVVSSSKAAASADAAAAVPAAAAPYTGSDLINGTDKPSQVTVVFTPGIVSKHLYDFDRYMVETIGNGDDPNEKITIKYKPTPAATPVAEGESTGWVFFTLPLKSINTNRFYGLSDHYAIVKQGKDAETATLILYDLDTKLKATSFSFSEPIFHYGNQLIFWQQVADPATPVNCPEYEVRAKAGGKPVMEELILMDLKAQKMVRTKVMRCAARSK